MNAITPETLYLILPFKVARLAMLLQKHYGLTLHDAIMAVYRSNTYRMLAKEETKLWHLGPVGLFEHYKEFG